MHANKHVNFWADTVDKFELIIFILNIFLFYFLKLEIYCILFLVDLDFLKYQIFLIDLNVLRRKTVLKYIFDTVMIQYILKEIVSFETIKLNNRLLIHEIHAYTILKFKNI